MQLELTEIPYGYCHCGCGGKTKYPPYSWAAKGWDKNTPNRFIHTHHRIAEVRANPPRLEDKYVVDEATGCWNWIGGRCELGYGLAHMPKSGRVRKTIRAHRLVYERMVGPIPEGLQLDHLCRNPSCVNPAHLEPVTPSENTRRGWESRRLAGIRRRSTLPVHWDKQRQRWTSRVELDGERHWLGTFTDRVDAERAAKAFFDEHGIELIPRAT